MSKRLLGEILRGWLIAATLFMVGRASAVDKFEIDSDRDTAYLPYGLTELRSGDRGVISKVDFHPVDIFQTADGDTGTGYYFVGYNPELNVDNPAIFSFVRYPVYRLMDDFPVRLIVNDWRFYNDRSTGLKGIVGGGYKNDSAFAFRLFPETNKFEKLFLVSGKDATGDGHWEPQVRLTYVGDYDYDGETEAFFYVDAERELHPRELFCVELETLRVEWSLPVASLVSTGAFFPCGDSLNPGVIFTTYNIKNGVADSNFSDQYGYLVRLDRQGKIVFRKINSVQHGMNALIPAERSGQYYLLHEKNLEDPEHFDTLRSTIFHISKIDDSGRVLKSLTTPVLPWYHWLMEFGPRRDTALYVAFENGITRVYSPDLELLAECENGRPGGYLGRISLPGTNDQAAIFTDGIYSSDLKKLAAFPPRVEYYRVLATDKGGHVRALAFGAGNYYGVFQIEKKTLWNILTIAYVRHRALVLMILSGLLVGLVIVNYYRKRTKLHLDFIQIQKNELEMAHSRLAATVDALPDILIELDRFGHIYLFRSPHPALFSSPPDEFVGCTIAEMFTVEAAGIIMDAVKEAGRVGRRTGDIFSLQLPGGINWFELSVSARGDFRSRDAHFIVLARDITRRKQVEDALRESEDRFHSIFDNAMVGMYRTTPDGRILVANPTLLNMLGYSSMEELSRRNLEQEGFEPDYPRAAFKERIERDGVITGMETVWRRHDGTQLYVRENARVVRDAEGRVLYYEGAVEDITGWKEAEEALRQSEERYRTLQANIPVGVFRSTPDGRVISVNPAAIKMLGYESEDELLGLSTIIAYANPSSQAELLSRLNKEGVISDYEFQARHRDGSLMWLMLSAQAIQDKNGQIEYIDGIARDITAQIAAETALRESEEKYRTLVDNIHDGIIKTDEKGRVTFANRAILERSGIPLEELTLSRFIDLVSPDDRGDFQEGIKLLMQGCKLPPYEFRYTTEAGQQIVIEIEAWAIHENGRFAGFQGLTRDVTERRRAEKALQESLSQSRAILNAIPDFMMQISKQGVFLNYGGYGGPPYVPPEQFLGKPVNEVLPPEPARLALHYIERTLRFGQLQVFEYQLPMPDGVHDYEARMVPCGDEEVLAIIRDISERKKAEMELAKAHRSLQKAHDELEDRVRERTAELTGANVQLSREIGDRQRAEEALRESERILRVFLDTLSEPAVMLDRQGIIFLANKELANRIGVSIEELTGRCGYDFLPADIAKSRRIIADEVFAQGRSLSFEDSVNGQHFINFIHPIKDAGDSVTKVAVYSLDITERRRAEEALRQSEERYRSLVETSNSLIICLDRHANIMVFNKECERVTGYSRDEVLGKCWHELFIPPEWRHEGLKDFARWVRLHPSDTYEGPLLTKAGEVRTILWSNSAIFLSDPERIIALAVGQDITVRKQVEQELRHSEEKYRLLVQSVPSSIALVNRDGQFLFVNEIAAGFVQKAADQIVGRTQADLFPPEIAARQMGSIREVIDTGGEMAVETRSFLGGRWLWFYTSIQPYRDASGRVTAALIIAHDITEQKLAAEKLLAAHQEKYQQARDIAGGVAHEIHNALCPAANAIDKLKQRLALTDDRDGVRNAELLALSEAAVARALGLTELVRTYSRLEAEQAAVEVDLKEVISEIVYLNALRINELSVTVRIDLPDGCRIRCNRNHAWSFFNNLMTNALDALAEAPSRAIAITAVKTAEHLQIEFADSGPGIPKEIQARIFDLFFSTRPSTGSGVGLATVRKIADLYGVAIDVKSDIDKGARFIILWPLPLDRDAQNAIGT